MMSPKSPKLPSNAFDRLNETYQHLFGRKSSPQNGGTNINREVRDTLVSPLLRQDMVEVLRESAQLGICTARISEASQRIKDNTFLVAVRDSWFRQLNDKDLILTTGSTDTFLDKNQLPNHWDWHLAIYQEHPEVKAIIFGHPPSLMVLGNKNILPTPDLLLGAYSIIGLIKISQPEPGDITYNVNKAKIIMVPGKGVISWGDSLAEAAANLELAERWGEISLRATK